MAQTTVYDIHSVEKFRIPMTQNKRRHLLQSFRDEPGSSLAGLLSWMLPKNWFGQMIALFITVMVLMLTLVECSIRMRSPIKTDLTEGQLIEGLKVSPKPVEDYGHPVK
ncbi:MAG: hypothetical protein AAFW47_03955 [Pseudomonadota bacterium]